MTEFLIAVLVFLAAHSLPAATGLRGRAIARIGRRAYLTLYSLLSLAVLAWLISAALRAPYVELWAPGPALMAVPLLAMLPACLLLAAGATRPNPLSVTFVGGPVDPEAPGILAVTRHPILWAFFLWAAGHAAANGDLVAVLLFGGFALFSLAGMPLLERRARRRGETEAFALTRGHLTARCARALSLRTGIELLAGLALYAALLAAHGPVIGVDPLAHLAL